MDISDYLTPAPAIGHAFLRNAGDFRDGSPQLVHCEPLNGKVD
jgi:hypothetical protein